MSEMVAKTGFQVQTTYGYYPAGTWGHAVYAPSLERAIVLAKTWTDTRVVNLENLEVVWTSDAP